MENLNLHKVNFKIRHCKLNDNYRLESYQGEVLYTDREYKNYSDARRSMKVAEKFYNDNTGAYLIEPAA